MKKLTILSIALFAFGITNAQETTKTKIAKKAISKKATVAKTPIAKTIENGAKMVFETETIDYGTIEPNSNGVREFVFVNSGKKPLIISSATGSCGCTVPTFPKEPIAPGAKGVISVKYDTSRAGQAFTKSVTVNSNSEGTPSKTLTIKGNVLPLPASNTPEVKN